MPATRGENYRSKEEEWHHRDPAVKAAGEAVGRNRLSEETDLDYDPSSSSSSTPAAGSTIGTAS